MKFENNDSENESIDISPLIDIVFILLIFFMVSTTFVKEVQLPLERPKASATIKTNDKTTRVTIDQQGAIYVNSKQVKPWLLQSSVRKALSAAKEKNVLVTSDKDLKVDQLVNVVDQCRLAGASNVAVSTDRI